MVIVQNSKLAVLLVKKLELYYIYYMVSVQTPTKIFISFIVLIFTL